METKSKFDLEELQLLAQELLDADYKSLSERKQRILLNIAEGELVSRDANKIYREQLTFGQKVADKVAQFGGSWTFIGIAVLTLSLWIGANSFHFIWGENPADPYPYILLNLGLSMLAALQAPIIMMSQNRRSERDRIESNANYETCMKIELDLTRLHQRLDEAESEKQNT